jgi:rRNA processing protein Gar1
MSKKRKFKKGDMVKNRLSKKVGVVTDIMGDPENPYALYVIVEGKKKRWVLRNPSSLSLFERFKRKLF